MLRTWVYKYVWVPAFNYFEHTHLGKFYVFNFALYLPVLLWLFAINILPKKINRRYSRQIILISLCLVRSCLCSLSSFFLQLLVKIKFYVLLQSFHCLPDDPLSVAHGVLCLRFPYFSYELSGLWLLFKFCTFYKLRSWRFGVFTLMKTDKKEFFTLLTDEDRP